MVKKFTTSSIIGYFNEASGGINLTGKVKVIIKNRKAKMRIVRGAIAIWP
jgi:hypothetical protein